jgi:hypothetical protein
MIEIYEYFDSAGANETLTESEWIHDYYIANIKEIFAPYYSHPAIHVWLNREKDWWHVQFCTTKKVENIVKPKFRHTIKRVHSMPEEAIKRVRWFISVIFMHDDYDKMHQLIDKNMQKAAGDSSSIDNTFYE